jgi:hypothetical protein
MFIGLPVSQLARGAYVTISYYQVRAGTESASLESTCCNGIRLQVAENELLKLEVPYSQRFTPETLMPFQIVHWKGTKTAGACKPNSEVRG